MRSSVARRTALLAAATTSLALLMAACTGKPDPTPSEPDGEGVLGGTNGVELSKGVLLISDGTPRVRIGDAFVTFPGPVTDAVWSPDGSRIAYVDGDGNIATARPDGTDVLVLTTTDPSVVRSRPTWLRQWIVYAEKKTDGTSALRSVPANGCPIGPVPATGQEWPMDTGEGTSYVDLAPNGANTERPMRLAFQHDEPGGPEIWINDSNQRVPFTYKVVDGSEPAVTLDGQRIAYVGQDGDIYVTMATEGAPAGTRLTSGAGHPRRLAWSPDGQYIAYATQAEVQQVSTGGGANAPTTLAAGTGVPSYLYGWDNVLYPVTGADPTALSVAASQARWPQATVFGPGQGYRGAFSATIGLANQPPSFIGYGPVFLLGSADQLDPRVVAELGRVFGTIPPNTPPLSRPRVYVDAPVSTAIDQELSQLGYHVVRGRPEPELTNPEVTDLCPPSNGPELAPELVVVNGADPAAVTIGRSFAGSRPVLELNGALTEAQITWLRRSSGVVEYVYVIGSVPEDVQQQVAEIVAGPLGYTTTHNPINQGPLY